MVVPEAYLPWAAERRWASEVEGAALVVTAFHPLPNSFKAVL